MKLDEVTADVAAQLDQQAKLGVQIHRVETVPETGPANRGVWHLVRNVTAVFADLKDSTGLNVIEDRETAARAYTYFVRAMAVILERFSADYVDIHGDGVFGLFSQSPSFQAAAGAITMKTLVERDVAVRLQKDAATERKLTAGIGIDQGELWVRRLGLRGTKQNEVWAGNPLNMAAKLSSVAEPDQLVVSERVFSAYQQASRIRQRVLFYSCGCHNGITGDGLDAPKDCTEYLWTEQPAPPGMSFDFQSIHRLESKWCSLHGAEFCEAIITGRRPD